jgi:hypothetical protein
MRARCRGRHNAREMSDHTAKAYRVQAGRRNTNPHPTQSDRGCLIAASASLHIVVRR